MYRTPFVSRCTVPEVDTSGSVEEPAGPQSCHVGTPADLRRSRAQPLCSRSQCTPHLRPDLYTQGVTKWGE